MNKKKIRKQDTPKMLMKNFGQIAYNDLSALTKEKEDLKRDGLAWPDFCDFPCHLVRLYLLSSASMASEDNLKDLELIREVHELASELLACWLWRRHKTIYRFDDASTKLLCDQAESSTGDEIIQIEPLINLPRQGVYIKAPGIMDGIDGFFFWVDAEITVGSENKPMLMIQWMHDDMVTTHNLMWPLPPGESIKDGAEYYIDTIRESHVEDVDRSCIEGLMSEVSIALPFIRYVAAESSKEEKVNGIAGEITVHDVCTDDLKKR